MDFLEIVRPELSLISCGKDNFYGHPHPELLKRLERANSKTLITYESGAITIKTDGKKLWISEYR
jgi:competence protein ComEC